MSNIQSNGRSNGRQPADPGTAPTGEVRYFRLPDAGEGLTEAEIVTWRVRPGDQVRVNDPIVEVETAKSLVELPCPFAGVVTELLVPQGQTVAVGTPIIAVATQPPGAPVAVVPDGAGAPGEPVPASAPMAAPTDPTAVQAAPAEGAVEPGLTGGPAPGARTPVLVGYGPRTSAAVRRRRLPSAGSGSGATVPPVPPAAPPSPAPGDLAPAAGTPTVGSGATVHVLAKPPVRKLARDLGLDLAAVPATGPGGIVTREDVERAGAGRNGSVPGTGYPAGPAAVPGAGRTAVREETGAEPFGPGEADATTGAGATARTGAGGVPGTGPRETRIPVRGVRKLTAEAMVASAFGAPHVTEWVAVDVSRTMRLVDRLRADREFAGVKVSPLLVVAKAVLIAVRRNPGINASWDGPAGEIVRKHYVNLGIAAATPRGLVVPNIKDADQLGLRGLADALTELTATAREGRTPPAALTGGTITITNVGVFGVDAGTPILNPPEAAILAFGQVRQLPWVHKGKVKPRWVTQLAVSFDHRLVDGDLGSRFLADVAAVLEDPSRALVWT